MDPLSTSSLQECNALNYFPSAVPDSPSNQPSQDLIDPLGSFEYLKPVNVNDPFSQFSEKVNDKMEAKSSDTKVIISIGPSRQPAPLMRYEFYNSLTRSEEINCELIKKSKLIQSKFSNLILDICSLLQESPTAYIEKLQLWLSFQSCSKSVEALQAVNSESNTFTAKTIPDFISSLRCYTSWYNYSLIADIARQFCPSKGCALVSAYEAELNDFFQMLILHCPPLFPDHHQYAAQSVELVEVKVRGWKASTAVLEDIALFKNTLCQVCDLDPRFLVIREIDTTNFKMLWTVPKSATGILSTAIKMHSGALYHKSSINCIKIADLEIDFQESKASNTEVPQALHDVDTIQATNIGTLNAQETPGPSTNFQEGPSTKVPSTKVPSTNIQKVPSTNVQEGPSQEGPSTNIQAGTNFQKVPNAIFHEGPNASASIQEATGRDDYDVSCNLHTPKESETSHRRVSREELRASRDRKALSLGTSLPSDENIFGGSSLLSEITKTLKVSNLLSYESVETTPSSEFTRQTESMSTIHSPVVHGEVFLQDIGSKGDVRSSMDVNSSSFLWRVLGRARPGFHANIHVVSIQTISKIEKEDIEVRKGQQLKALYRMLDKVCVQTPLLEEGFIPYSACRLSRKHYGSKSKLIQLSYVRLYPKSPDGIDTLQKERIPSIKMVAVSCHFPPSHEELRAQINQTFTVLYCDSEWIYATSDKTSGLLPRSTCVLSQDSKNHFKQWDQNVGLFQSDFIIKYDIARPQILDESPIPVCITYNSVQRAASVQVQRSGSKVGKMFTIIQNFVPTLSPTSGTFTIRKGLRVKVVEESGKLVRVRTKTGTSFWIPQNHVRPARKNSEADKFLQP